MADRTAAALFAAIFETLADHSLEIVARKFWDMSGSYDFRPYQMGCDDALVRLGLAKRTEESIVYLGEDGFDGDL